MGKPGAGVRVVCGAVGACLAGRIVAAIRTLPARGLPALQCRLVCNAGGSGVGRDGRKVCKLSSVQFSSVQFSSVQFSSVQFIAVQVRSGQFSSDIACTHARMHWLATAVRCRMSHGRTPARIARRSRRLLQPLRTRWRALSPGSLTLSTTRSSFCCCSLTNENKSSIAILWPHSLCKRHLQPESSAAKSWSSSIHRDELRRQAAADDCSSRRHPAA